MLVLLALPFAVAFVLSLAGTALVRRLAPRWGLVDMPGGRKIHARPTPLGGGLALFAAVWITVGAALAAAALGRAGVIPLPPALAEHAGGALARAGRIGWVFAGGLLLALVGLVDDLRGLSPWPRLAVQTLVATGLVALDGQYVTIFIRHPVVCGALTVLWTVGITNTFNLLDNMDGLSAGVAVIVLGFFAAVSLQTGQVFPAALSLALIGALGGFLVFNFPPASIFMGDCGSTFIGYMVAVVSIHATFYIEGRPLYPVVVPLLILSVPLFDTISVVAIRLRQGRSPFSGDRNHFSHRLVALGMSPRRAVLTIYLVAASVGLGATVLYHVATTGGMVIVLLQAAAVFAVIVLLEQAGRRALARAASGEGRASREGEGGGRGGA